jgi:hypothetical protein
VAGPPFARRLLAALDPADGLVDGHVVGVAIGELLADAKIDTKTLAWIVENHATVADALTIVSHVAAGRSSRLALQLSVLLGDAIVRAFEAAERSA